MHTRHNRFTFGDLNDRLIPINAQETVKKESQNQGGNHHLATEGIEIQDERDSQTVYELVVFRLVELNEKRS